MVNIDTTKNLKIKEEKEFLTKSFEDFVNKGCIKIYQKIRISQRIKKKRGRKYK